MDCAGRRYREMKSSTKFPESRWMTRWRFVRCWERQAICSLDLTQSNICSNLMLSPPYILGFMNLNQKI